MAYSWFGSCCDVAIEIAIEHCRWARQYGMSAREVGQSIGLSDVLTWDDAVWAVAGAWDEAFRPMAKSVGVRPGTHWRDAA